MKLVAYVLRYFAAIAHYSPILAIANF
jgi:hypothetical protein